MNIHTAFKRTLLLAALIAASIGAWADGEETPTNVAKIGDTEYTTLQQAVEAATSGSTIVLTSDITISTIDERLQFYKAITLDMNGHTITSHIGECLYVWNSGDLTITGNGTITGPTDEAGKALDGFAVITVNGDAQVDGTPAKLTFVNGTLTSGGVGSDGMYGVYVLNGASATFGSDTDHTGPSITSWFAAVGTNNTTAPVDIKFYGGTYKAQAAPTGSEWWYYFCAPVYAAAAGEFTISGGTFDGYYAISSPYSNAAQTLDITGGTFTGTLQALFVGTLTGGESSSTRTVAVSGGTFSSEVDPAYCSGNFAPQYLGNGTYGVIYVLKMTDTDNTDLTGMHGKTVNAIYTRTLGMDALVSNAGTKYGTICLPFNITSQPEGMTLYKATNINGNTLTIQSVTATSEAPIVAGTPLIFELNSAATTMTITSNNVTVDTTAPATTATTDNILIGTYTAKTIEESLTTIFYLNGDRFHQAKVKLTVPAFRAYLVDADPSQVKSDWLSISTDDETAISNVDVDPNAVVDVYDMNGRKQNALQRGVNIMHRADGRTIKVIVK